MEQENKVEEKVEEITPQSEESKTEGKDAANKAKDIFKKISARCTGLCTKVKIRCGKNGTIIAAVVLVLAIAISYGYKQYREKVDIGSEAIKTKIEKFAKEQIPQAKSIEIAEVTVEGQLYKVIVSVDKSEIPVYVTKDGKKLIQNVVELDGKQPEPQQQEEEKTEAEQKADVPTVDLFVMSYCPYGTQIEKGIIPVLETLGKKIDFNLKFVDYAMHNQVEVDENLLQYCIQKTQEPKLNNYLKCFLKKGEGTSDACMKTAGINATQVKACMTETDKKFAINESVKDKSKWDNAQFPPFNVDKEDNEKFGVQGSPTLVINGTKVSSGRDSASLLKAVCSGFNNQPKECEKELSSASPAPGFGEGTATAGSASAAACGQ